MEVTFTHPIYLWTLLIIPILIVLYILSVRYSRAMALKFANFVALSRVSGGVREVSSMSMLAVRMISLALVILSISGITIWYVGETSYKDYVLAIDASSSMLADDFAPTRLDAAKTAAMSFVEHLPLNSYIGILSFSGVSFVDQPLTQQKSFAKDAISNIKVSSIGGTDFGNAIMTGTNILLPSNKAKVVVLLTDGRSNIGISEATAIQYANGHHVIVHTIGIGATKGLNEFDLGVDEESLKLVANATLGNYYLATNADELTAAYDKIVNIKSVGKNPIELAFPLLVISLFLLLVDWLLGNTLYRRIP